MYQPFITEELLTELGINLSDQDTNSLLDQLNKTLQERIGTEITDSLDDQQLQELLKLKETASDKEVGLWIEKNVPDVKQITQDEVDILLGELSEDSDSITKTTES